MPDHTELSSAEIAALWSTYMQDSAAACFLKHFLQHNDDPKITQILKKSLNHLQLNTEKIKTIYEQEQYPVPIGFTDKDVDLSAPPLFSDIYALSFVYRMCKVTLVHYGTMSTHVARNDVLNFFCDSLESTSKLLKKSVNLMLSKGIYDRPPKINYPDKAQFVEKQSFLTGWFGRRRPINSIELGEAFFTVERNYIGLLLLLGLIQSAKDNVIKEYLIRGKKLSEKQIDVFNNIIKEEGYLGSVPVSMEVTDSTVSPFSDKLIMFMISASTASGIYLLGHALSVSMRRDLAALYAKTTAEIGKYAEDGINIMIERGWLEKPPQ